MKQHKSVAVFLAVLLFPCYVFAQQKNDKPENGLGVEVSTSAGQRLALYVLASDPKPANLFGIIAVPDGGSASSISGFKFIPSLENGVMRIEVSALVGKREQPIASYRMRKGETHSLSVASYFGTETFEITVVDARRIPMPPAMPTFGFPVNSFSQNALHYHPIFRIGNEEKRLLVAATYRTNRWTRGGKARMRDEG